MRPDARAARPASIGIGTTNGLRLTRKRSHARHGGHATSTKSRSDGILSR